MWQPSAVHCCPTPPPPSCVCDLLSAVSGHVKLWPISLHLLEGSLWKAAALTCFGSKCHPCHHVNTPPACLLQHTTTETRLRFLCQRVAPFSCRKAPVASRHDMHASSIVTSNRSQRGLWHEAIECHHSQLFMPQLYFRQWLLLMISANL